MRLRRVLGPLHLLRPCDGEAGRCATIQNDRACICVPQLQQGRGAFRLFTEGDALYDAMLASIKAARSAIRLESFIFAADEIGWRFAKTLAERARAGLEVRFHFDSQGAAFRPSSVLYQFLEEAGVRLKWYHPLDWWHPNLYLQRNHRKLLVIDEEEAFLGGFNIRYENSRTLYGEGRQRDTHVSVRGELARHAAALFDRLWSDEDDPHVDAIPDDASDLDALLVPNFSRRCQKRLACLHAGLIETSRRYVYLTTPYFCPGIIIGEALREAAQRGVDVRLLVPQNSDPFFVGWATRSAYGSLLGAGVRIHEYVPRKLHAKTSVIDGDWAIVGSANLDYLSLFVNHEMVMIARDPDLSEALRDQYMRDLADASEVLPSVWEERAWSERCLEVVGRAARRLF